MPSPLAVTWVGLRAGPRAPPQTESTLTDALPGQAEGGRLAGSQEEHKHCEQAQGNILGQSGASLAAARNLPSTEHSDPGYWAGTQVGKPGTSLFQSLGAKASGEGGHEIWGRIGGQKPGRRPRAMVPSPASRRGSDSRALSPPLPQTGPPTQLFPSWESLDQWWANCPSRAARGWPLC